MKLTLEQIKQITKGAVRFSEDDDGIRLYRFTAEQEQLYKESNKDFYEKTFCNAGMKFVFKTNSKTFVLKADVEKRNSRKYFSFDVFADEKQIGYLDNFSDVKLPDDYTEFSLPLGEYSKTFELGEGVKKVTVYLPWNVSCVFKEISVDDNAFVEPVKIEKKVLVFGDSITQGYDALRPSNRYAARIAESLEAEEINKAIGGEIFFPPLAETKEDFYPDYVTVAYGTNDWSKTEEEDFKVKSKAFYSTLSRKYPKAKIFAITPIWRKDYQEYRPFGAFEDMVKDIEEAVQGLENVVLIHGFDFVPKDSKYYADLRLHPKDEGFEHYFKNLRAEMEKNYCK